MRSTILVVDDDPADLTLLAGLLAGRGYRVRHAPDAVSALVQVIRRPPDLVLTDRLAPRLEGFVLLAHLRLAHHLLPVVIVHHIATKSRVPGLVALDGVTAIVAKPTSYQDAEPLLAVIARLLARTTGTR